MSIADDIDYIVKTAAKLANESSMPQTSKVASAEDDPSEEASLGKRLKKVARVSNEHAVSAGDVLNLLEKTYV